ncbi:hypothetical protein KIW84_032755 [Lathyrus oleraceus]|uniref:Protein kinase domain-containing protein n=1 Tax=Pisum sativum TaxID=3888 RepID=A0A9D5B2R1_PEA|nr:hypothetical protein KIW84_032755 [Pisum sativum]
MDSNNWMPNQGSEPTLDTADWRIQLHPESRRRIVNKIMGTLKKHLPVSGNEGLLELRKIAQRFEDKIYAAATSQSGINAITSRNASKFSESGNFSLVPYGGEVQTGSAQSPTSSVGNEYTASVGGGGVFNSSQDAADEYDFGDFVFHDSAVSSFGEASNIPDIIESTVGLLAAVEDFKTATQNPVKLADVKTEVEADGSAEKVMESANINTCVEKANKLSVDKAATVWKKLSESNEMIDENWLRFYWQQILQAVNTIHEERIVHSNLKLSNFLQAKEAEQAFRFAS